MTGEVSWEDVDDAREVIADVRDPDCELKWVLFGYGSDELKKISIVEAGESDLKDAMQLFEPKHVLYLFAQVGEKAYAFIQWLPDDAPIQFKAKASIHRSFITNYLGSLTLNIVASSLDDLTEDKIEEELGYYVATLGKVLNDQEAALKLNEAEKRKKDQRQRETWRGNTVKAAKSINNVTVTSATGSMLKGSDVNVPKKAPIKTLSHTMYQKANIEVEFEEEDALKELCLDLREANIEEDTFSWLILGYVEGKKNTLHLIETGNGGRDGLAGYVREEMNGALDKCMYMLIKEDDSSSKCTYVCWIGKNVPAFVKANISTHRGAISSWITTVVHNLQEEIVESVNDLLGVKDEDDDSLEQVNESVANVNESVHTSHVQQIDSQLQSKPYAGKVLEDVVREKTPHEIWLERKMNGGNTATSKPKDLNTSVQADREFKNVVLKKKDENATRKTVGRSRFAQKKVQGSDCSSDHGSDASIEKAYDKNDYMQQAQQAALEAQKLEDEAAKKRAAAKMYEERARHSELVEVMGEEPDWSPEDLSEAENNDEVVDNQEHEKEVSKGEHEVPESKSSEPSSEIARAPSKEASPKKTKEAPSETTRHAKDEEKSVPQEQAKESPPQSRTESSASVDGNSQSSQAQAAAPENDTEKEKMKSASQAEEKAAEEKLPKPSVEDSKTPEASTTRQEPEVKSATDGKDESSKEKIAHPEEMKEPPKEAEKEDSQTKSNTPTVEAQIEPASNKSSEAPVESEKSKAHESEDVNNHGNQVNLSKALQRIDEEKAEVTTTLPSDKEKAVDSGKVVENGDSSISKVPSTNDGEAKPAEQSKEDSEKLRILRDALSKQELEAKQARLAAARKALDDARALSSSLFVNNDSGKENDQSRISQPNENHSPKKIVNDKDTKHSDEDEIRRKAEELLARKKALLEEAAKRHSRNASSSSQNDETNTKVNAQPDADRLKRAEEYRQKKMAELASKKASADDAAAKKAAFLREAEEAVKRASAGKQ
uniref:ADF-H domain-containing protein n=1 Tax=Guillardia theta TaxID=55529 RepID=A0A7S4KMT6_GUITH